MGCSEYSVTSKEEASQHIQALIQTTYLHTYTALFVQNAHCFDNVKQAALTGHADAQLSEGGGGVGAGTDLTFTVHHAAPSGSCTSGRAGSR